MATNPDIPTAITKAISRIAFAKVQKEQVVLSVALLVYRYRQFTSSCAGKSLAWVVKMVFIYLGLERFVAHWALHLPVLSSKMKYFWHFTQY
jgi:hypothetical protein